MRTFLCVFLTACFAGIGVQAPADEGAAESGPIFYDLSIVGIDIGDATVAINHTPDDAYRIGFEMDFRFLFWSGGAEAVSTGGIGRGTPAPEAYNVAFNGVSGPVSITTTFDDGGPAAWSISPPPDKKYLINRIPHDEDDLKGAIDPLSALFIRAETATSACDRTLPVFTGGTRLDLVLTPGRETGSGHFQCEVAYVPVSGHREDSESVARLVKSGPTLTIFEAAPGLWAPHRVGLPTSVGELAITRITPDTVN